MKTRAFVITTLFLGSMIFSNASAINLIDVYNQALSSDPTFKAARSQWLADKENLSIKRSSLFPQLSANGGFSRNYANTQYSAETGEPSSTSYNDSSSYSLTLTQPLFNFGNWANIWQAQAIVKKAEVTFLAAAEDLLLRTSKAYFGVLQSKDVLSFAKANREALQNTLDQTKHKYDVGLIAIVDLENARADYDNAIAEEIAAKNNLEDKLEQLNEITGVRYVSLDPVKKEFPLLTPQPPNIEKWAQAAQQQNFDLAAARYVTISARENIKIQNAGHLPTLNATGGYSYAHNDNYNGSNGSQKSKNASAGLTLAVPLFQGGYVLASAKQANYQYQKAIADQEIRHRSTISLTRQAYLNVLSDVSKIKANKQSIRSSLSSLRATKAGYEAGTRTMVDVLQAQAKLYDRQKDFATSEYDYIIQFLTLKQLTGILDVDDLTQINSWLVKSSSGKNKTPAKNKTKQVKKQNSPSTTTKNTKPKIHKKPDPTNKAGTAKAAPKKQPVKANKKISSSNGNATTTPKQAINTSKNKQPVAHANIKIISTVPADNLTNTTQIESLNNQ
jgi:outer membrane protein